MAQFSIMVVGYVMVNEPMSGTVAYVPGVGFDPTLKHRLSNRDVTKMLHGVESGVPRNLFICCGDAPKILSVAYRRRSISASTWQSFTPRSFNAAASWKR